MSINRRHLRVAAFSSAIVLLCQTAPAMAEPQKNGNMPVGSVPAGNRPVQVTFKKWVTDLVFVPVFGITEGRVLMQGHTGGDIPGAFVGEVLQRQPSAHPAFKTGIIKLEAIYEVHDSHGNHVFTALIRGGTNQATGVAILDGVVVAGWRTGASVRVKFLTRTGCEGAPTPTTTCFEGIIHVAGTP